MANIVIYSDGTGQRGGLLFDERRSNIYKLFRATRCGPDSSVNPAEQLTFYDPGLGTRTPGHGGSGGFFAVLWRIVYNYVSQATGLGITRNIVDCYAAIIRMWRPGDQIFLFGFSRGAYTIRCVAAVLGFCGVPTRDEAASPLCRNEKTIKRIASEAVKHVYQHTESRQEIKTDRQKELLVQRSILADRFREKYRSAEPNDAEKSNAYPYFIGAFDTVASLVNPVIATVLFGLALALFGGILWFLKGTFVWIWIAGALTIAAVVGFIAFAKSLIRFEIGLPRKKKWKILHLVEVHQAQYETHLNPNIRYARHALAIDERRRAFDRVAWGGGYSKPQEETHSFEQVWFAGDHSDVGGSYLENESRLSDISLDWMLTAAVKAGLKYDPSVLQLYPDPTGPQHDEVRGSIFRFLPKIFRTIPPDAPLHPSVLGRFQVSEILDYDTMKPYRPENLREHQDVRQFY